MVFFVSTKDHFSILSQEQQEERKDQHLELDHFRKLAVPPGVGYPSSPKNPKFEERKDSKSVYPAKRDVFVYHIHEPVCYLTLLLCSRRKVFFSVFVEDV